MPRIGITPEEQSVGGSNFDFAEGRGRIVAATICNHEIPGYPPASCAYKLTIQRLDDKWKPTSDEPQDEIVNIGSAGEIQYENGGTAIAKFHPGRAASSTDDFGGVEPWGNPKFDCGEEDGAEGNVILVNPDWGKGPDKKAKASLFASSLIEHGVKRAMLNGFAPNLVGLEAHFTRFMMEKPRNSKKTEPPTCLIVGKAGKVTGIETKEAINKYPGAQIMSAKLPPAGAAPKPGSLGPGPVVAGSKPNGAPGAPAPQNTADDIPEFTEGAAASDPVSATAQSLLIALGVSGAGQTVSKTKLLTRLRTKFATERIDPKLHTPIEALINSDWLVKQADDMDWTLTGEGAGMTITLPAVG